MEMEWDDNWDRNEQYRRSLEKIATKKQVRMYTYDDGWGPYSKGRAYVVDINFHGKSGEVKIWDCYTFSDFLEISLENCQISINNDNKTCKINGNEDLAKKFLDEVLGLELEVAKKEDYIKECEGGTLVSFGDLINPPKYKVRPKKNNKIRSKK